MAKILFLASPGVTILQPKVYQELSYGSVLMAGALESHGFEVHFYDLNAALGRIRQEERLSLYEQEVLTDLDLLNQELQHPGQAVQLRAWMKQLLQRMDLTIRYDAIAISLGFTGWGTTAAQATINYSLMIAHELKKYFPVPIFAGGKEILKDLGKEYREDIFRKVENCPIQTFFTRKGHEIFPLLLQQYFEGKGPLAEGVKFVEENSNFKSSKVMPKYDIKNREDIFVQGKDLFPNQLLNKYPVLNDQAPFTIVPWRHSMGCPYKCNFCDMGLDPILRIQSVEEIVHFLSRAKSQGFENFRWFNDNLNLGPKFPEQLADKIIEANIDILFSDSANLQHTSIPLFQKLRKAGCVKLWFGTETMSNRMLGLINKGHDLEDVYRTLEAGNAADIWNSLNIIVAFPHETHEDYLKTFEFFRDRTDLWDCFDMNIYRLLTGTSYQKFPEKHQIRILDTTLDNRMSAFDEIGGMTWNEREKVSVNRFNSFFQVCPEDKKALIMNDYIYFYLKRCGFQKMEVKKILEEYFDHYSRENNTSYIAHYLERNVEENRRIDLGKSIQGRLFMRPIGDRLPTTLSN